MVEKIDVISQIKTCIKNKRNFIIDAGAGSGKTYSLIQTIEYILKEPLKDSQRILCVTFTNAAKNEIMERLFFDTKKIIVSTLHDFIWDFIKPFQINLRLEVEKLSIEKLGKLQSEVLEAKRKIDNPKGNTNIEKQRKIIGDNDQRILKYQNIDYKSLDISYDLYSAYYKGKISHDDIIIIMSNFLEHEFFSKLLLSSFPYILIDEYQDTDWNVVEKILFATTKYKNDFFSIVGMFGDRMQMIYKDSSFDFDSQDLVQINKEDNFRTASEIVNSNNIFRNDGLIQCCKNQNPKVRFEKLLFIYNKSQDFKLNSYINKKEEFSRYKRLYLANKNIANEIGFNDISDAFNSTYNKNANEKLLKLEDQFIAYVMRNIIDTILKFEKKDYYGLIQKRNVVNEELLIALHSDMANLVTQENQSLNHYIDFFKKNKLIDEKKYQDILTSYDYTECDLISNLLDVNINQFKKLSMQINNQTSLDTLHGVKGNEFSKVIVNIFENQPWKKYNFDKLLLFVETNIESVKKAHKLLYVACTRAKNSLIINYIADPDSTLNVDTLKTCVKKHYGDKMEFLLLD